MANPFAKLCYLEVHWTDPDANVLKASGWVAGRDRGLICTAGHNLKPRTPGLEIAGINVWIGGEARRSPFAIRRDGLKWTVHPAWNDGFDRANDIALLTVGNLSGSGSFAFHDRAQENLPVRVMGYSKDGDSEARSLPAVIDGHHSGILRYGFSSKTPSVGMSGGPVCARGQDDQPIVVAIHTRYPENGHGYGVRMTTDHIKWIASHR